MPKAFITDIDGTLTDDRRRLSMHAVEEIRRLVDAGIPVVLASGNTVCFIDALSKMIGTSGDIIAENGGVYRHGYTGMRHAEGDRSICLAAYHTSSRKEKNSGSTATNTGTPTSHLPVTWTQKT